MKPVKELAGSFLYYAIHFASISTSTAPTS